MKWFTDIHQRQVRFEDEGHEHIPKKRGEILWKKK